MIKLGIQVLDDKLKNLPEDSSLLFISAPGIDPSPYGVTSIYAMLNDGKKCIYIVNNKSPDAIRQEAERLGYDLKKYEDNGDLVLVDAYSSCMCMPSDEKIVVENPQDMKSIYSAIEEILKEMQVVLLDSMSSYMDLVGNGVDEFLSTVEKIKDDATVIVLFSFWEYEPEKVKRIKESFENVISLRPVEEITIVRQFLFAEKIDKKEEKITLPVRVLKPGGVRVYFPKILVTGPFAAGKSTMVKAMSTSAVSVDRMGTTIAMDHGYLDYKGFSADIYGTPGQELFDPILLYLADESVAVILVINAADVKSFPRAKRMLQLTRAHAIPLIVAANHYDRDDALPIDNIRKMLELDESIPIIPTVATEGKGVRDLLDALINKLIGKSQEGV